MALPHTALGTSSFAPGSASRLQARRAPAPSAARGRQNMVMASVEKRIQLKGDLLREIDGTGRGVKANDEKREAIDTVASRLEKINPNKKSLASDAINGRWKLVYTTSDSILGTNKPAPFRPNGPIYQTIDAGSLKAKNQETWPFFNSVKADLTPANDSLVDVQFKEFTLFNLITVKAPGSAKGKLDTTYVDGDLRIGRGDKGNLFVLVRDGEERLS